MTSQIFEQKPKQEALKCPFCGNHAKLVGGDAIYPHRPDLFAKRFYLCESCDAYVGCHGNTVIPLGTLANEPLRRARNRAHTAFDPLWKLGEMRCGDAYGWLAEKLGISKKETHIALFTETQCLDVVNAVRERKAQP